MGLQGWLTAILRAVSKLMAGLPFVLAIGCQRDETAVVPPAPVVVATAVEAPRPVPQDAGIVSEAVDSGPRALGMFNITFYYVIGEEEVPAKAPRKPANDNELVSIEPQEVTSLYDSDCKQIAEVSPEFASQLALQGTGKLRDGRILNIWGSCKCAHSPCFKVTAAQWGTAGTGKPLQPFRTVAVDPKVVKLGSLLYVPLLEGRTMPGRAPWGGYVHDGCVIADDVGGGIDGNQLDLFVGRKAYFLGLSGHEGSHSWAKHVPVYDGTAICERKGREVGRKTGSI